MCGRLLSNSSEPCISFPCSECLSCMPQCKTCSDSFSCLTCQNSFFLKIGNGPMDCVSQCPEYFYLDELNKVCLSCKVGCKTCEDGNSCLTCDYQYFSQTVNGKTDCVTKCQTNWIVFGEICLSECPLELSWNGYLCVSKCPDYFFPNSSKICMPCFNNCLECNGPFENQCLKCSPSYYFLPDQGRCTDSCPDGYYKEESTKTCAACKTSCIKCFNQDHCSQCRDGFELIDSICKFREEIFGELIAIYNPFTFKVKIDVQNWKNFLSSGEKYLQFISIDSMEKGKDFTYVMNVKSEGNFLNFYMNFTFNKTFRANEKKIMIKFSGEDRITNGYNIFFINQTLSVSLNECSLICPKEYYLSSSNI